MKRNKKHKVIVAYQTIAAMHKQAVSAVWVLLSVLDASDMSLTLGIDFISWNTRARKHLMKGVRHLSDNEVYRPTHSVVHRSITAYCSQRLNTPDVANALLGPWGVGIACIAKFHGRLVRFRNSLTCSRSCCSSDSRSNFSFLMKSSLRKLNVSDRLCYVMYVSPPMGISLTVSIVE